MTLSCLETKVLRRLFLLPAEENSESNQEYTCRKIVEDYLSNTTTHGIGRVHLATKVLSRLLWVLIFLFMMTMLVRNVLDLGKKLGAHDVLTQTDTHSGSNGMAFPAVTICNENAFSGKRMGLFFSGPAGRSMKKDGEARYNINNQDLLRLQMDNMTSKDVDWLGQTQQSFFEANTCWFGNENCSYSSHFAKRTSAVKGNCFTFNPNGSMHQLQPGLLYGLFLVINIEQDDYDTFSAGDVNLAAGVNIVLHNADQSPSYYGHFYTAGPGQLSRFALRKRIIKRAKYPYKDNCTNGMERPKSSKTRYTTEMCLSLCFVEKMLDRCGVVDSITRLEVQERFDQTLPSPKNANDSKCVAKFWETFTLKGGLGCHCQAPCEQIEYDAYSTTALWPANAHIDKFVNKAKLQNANASIQYVRDNYVAVQIYYRDFTVETIRHKPAYDLTSFASDLGGQLGLWIGASMFSAFEFITFILELSGYGLIVRRLNKHVDISPERKI